MEYAAVFLLFSVTVATAMRVCVSGKGIGILVFLVLTTLSLCPEQAGEDIGVAPALGFAAYAGAAYIGYKKDLTALLCSFVVAIVAVAVPMTSGADIAGVAYVCCAAFCALILKPFSAGGALVIGYVLGDTYSFFADKGLIFRYELFSLDTVYTATFCVILAIVVSELTDAGHPTRHGSGMALRNLRV